MTSADTGSTPAPDREDPALTDLVLQALQAHPLGISEYELIQWIKSSGYAAFQNVVFWDRLSLFQTHFLLFHTLYQLKDRLWQQKRGTLQINPLNIMLLPPRDSDTQTMDTHDPLREYYLDLANLTGTSDEDLQELLINFWRQLGNKDKRTAALAELELEDPVDYAAIKHQHRRLVMQHHPDRGGSKDKLQAINAAMELLKELHRE
ncbi:MAG: DNA-J related domain-containing protein [Gammaproteobacteria bacterium]|jgi:hypothetical protein